MEWWLVIAASYLSVGLIVTWMASIGHKMLYGRPIGWHTWVAGPIAWLPGMIWVALRRKM